MEASDMSGAELGRRLVGTDKSLVSRWRSGFARPEAETVARIADIFGVDQIALLQLAEWLPGEPKPIDPRRASVMMMVRDEISDDDLAFLERLLAHLRPSARAKSDSSLSAKTPQAAHSSASASTAEGVDATLEDRKQSLRSLAFLAV